jgi:hypothetical protein
MACNICKVDYCAGQADIYKSINLLQFKGGQLHKEESHDREMPLADIYQYETSYIADIYKIRFKPVSEFYTETAYFYDNISNQEIVAENILICDDCIKKLVKDKIIYFANHYKIMFPTYTDCCHTFYEDFKDKLYVIETKDNFPYRYINYIKKEKLHKEDERIKYFNSDLSVLLSLCPPEKLRQGMPIGNITVHENNIISKSYQYNFIICRRCMIPYMNKISETPDIPAMWDRIGDNPIHADLHDLKEFCRFRRGKHWSDPVSKNLYALLQFRENYGLVVEEFKYWRAKRNLLLISKKFGIYKDVFDYILTYI